MKSLNIHKSMVIFSKEQNYDFFCKTIIVANKKK